jgi:hypothetical protein
MNRLFLDLAATKAVLISRGRADGDWIDERGCVCLGAAIAIATGCRSTRPIEIEDYLVTDDRARDCLEAIDAALGETNAITPPLARVVEFNDEPLITDAAVLAVVQRAADAASMGRRA